MPLLEHAARGVSLSLDLALRLLHLFMRRVLSAELAEFISFQPIRIVLLVLVRRIVPLLAGRAGQIDDLSHLLISNTHYSGYAKISVTTPEPTVLPPSRTAKRKP